ncbi:unnamed protein product, partial [Prorocentrum cordatum]
REEEVPWPARLAQAAGSGSEQGGGSSDAPAFQPRTRAQRRRMQRQSQKDRGAGRRRCSPSRPRASPPRARLSRHRPSRRSPPTPEPLAARTRQSQGAPAAGRGVGGCRERRLWGEALARRRHGRPRWARLDSLIFHRWALASLFRESRYSSGTRGCDPARLAQTGTGLYRKIFSYHVWQVMMCRCSGAAK